MSSRTATTLVKNAGFAGFQHVITASSSLLIMLFLPRYLGAVEYGWLFLAASIVAIFRVAVDYGGAYLVAKHVARNPELTGQVMVNAMGFRVVFAVISVALIMVYGYAVGYSGEILRIMFIYAVGLLWQGPYISLYASYQGREMMQYPSLAATAERLFQVVTVLIAIAMRANVAVIAILYVAGQGLGVLIFWRFLRKIVVRLPKIDWSSTVHQIKEGTPYFLFAVFGTIYYRIGSIMLSWMTPEAVVGWYGAAFRLFESFNYPAIFTPVVFPLLSRLWVKESSTHRVATLKTLEYAVLVGMPMSAGAVLFSPQFTELFYGSAEFGPTVILLQLLCGGLILLYVDMFLGTTLLASERQGGQAVLSLIAIPVNVGLNLVLIPYYQSSAGNGAIGAALGIGLTEIVIMAGMIYLMPEGVLKGFRYSVIVKSLLSSGIMAGVIWGTGLLGVPWVLQILIGAAVYVGAVLSMRVLEPVEKEFYGSIIRERLLSRFRRNR